REGAAYVRAALPDAEIAVVEEVTPGFAAAVCHADAVVCIRLRAEDTAGAKRLRLGQAPGAGTDGSHPRPLAEGGALCNTRGDDRAVAEWVVLAMLALSRRLIPFDAGLRRGEWRGRRRPGERPHDELAGRTAGVVGLGHIGARVAELARCLGMRTIAVTR